MMKTKTTVVNSVKAVRAHLALRVLKMKITMKMKMTKTKMTKTKLMKTAVKTKK